MLDGINFGKWKIEYNIWNINVSKSLKEQVGVLNEDILQATYIDEFSNQYLLDIGWYPEFDTCGHFMIYIINIIKNFVLDNRCKKQNAICKFLEIICRNVLIIPRT